MRILYKVADMLIVTYAQYLFMTTVQILYMHKNR